MNYQNELYIGAQSVAGFKVGQNLRRRKSFEFPGGSALWVAASKISCLMLVVVLGIGLWVGAQVSQTNVAIQAVEAQQHLMRGEQVALLAQRAQLMSAKHVRQQAKVELALYVPGKGQVYKM